jgi:O-antigen/teichoic acid export membrane protein
VGWLLYPMLGFVFAFAGDLVALVYTASYVDAAPVMRVYIVGLVVLVIEVSSMLQLLRQGVFNALLNAGMLVASVAASWLAGQHIGLAGAAAGSVAALYIDRFVTLRRIKAITGVRVRDQQHWASLGRLAAASAAATLLAWLAARQLMPEASHFARLLAGAAFLGTCYAALTFGRLRRALR